MLPRASSSSRSASSSKACAQEDECVFGKLLDFGLARCAHQVVECARERPQANIVPAHLLIKRPLLQGPAVFVPQVTGCDIAEGTVGRSGAQIVDENARRCVAPRGARYAGAGSQVARGPRLSHSAQRAIPHRPRLRRRQRVGARADGAAASVAPVSSRSRPNSPPRRVAGPVLSRLQSRCLSSSKDQAHAKDTLDEEKPM